jgi:hypothetical protein
VIYHGLRQSISKWLFPAIESNIPYDRFVRAAPLHPTTPEDPKGFLVGVNWRGTVSASQIPAMQAAQNTRAAFPQASTSSATPATIVSSAAGNSPMRTAWPASSPTSRSMSTAATSLPAPKPR